MPERFYRIGLSQIGRILASGLVAVCVAACGNNPSNEVADGPCPGESGFGARIEGSEGPIDVCVTDDSVTTVFTERGWYDVTARMTESEGTVYEFYLLFPHHATARKLNLTGNLAEAIGDANGAWFHFVEIPPGGPALESTAVTAGTFRLGYSDTEVVAGSFEDIVLEMSVSGLDSVAGARRLPLGFLSVLTDTMEFDATR